MVLEVIYVTRHGYRSNWAVNHITGEYVSPFPTPTGIHSDPALSSHGVDQSKELAKKIVTLDPPVDIIYSSPFYRCLQTLKPSTEKLFAEGKAGGKVRVENGLGEFYGIARFDHPSPAALDALRGHFANLHPSYSPLIRPSVKGESLPDLHNRLAYTLHRIISALDADPNGPKAMLICTHAASMIAIGRALTGKMPDNPDEDDFQCFTCSLSVFRRRGVLEKAKQEVEVWKAGMEKVPVVDWKGKGVMGGWNCLTNGDCSFLSAGPERGWKFSGDESFLNDPNAFNDAQNDAHHNTDMTEPPVGSTKGSRL